MEFILSAFISVKDVLKIIFHSIIGYLLLNLFYVFYYFYAVINEIAFINFTLSLFIINV